MTDSRQILLQRVIRGCSRVLLFAGALVFLFGDAFLYEIKHMHLLVAEVACILGGALLMLLGAGIGIAGKSPSPEQRFPK